ncbi:hypothetical protein [Cryobacterium sp. Y82]|uniref:hypothetical protein n=1 Tax=Cryobacterium sp. Y82 TaxID=2045017 RepID=UPI000CE37727|nr:hypothetical protein [Cryobacterium sp. Y82]
MIDASADLMEVDAVATVKTDDVVDGRLVGLLTGRDVAAAVRSTKAEVRRIERQQQFDGLVVVRLPG